MNARASRWGVFRNSIDNITWAHLFLVLVFYVRIWLWQKGWLLFSSSKVYSQSLIALRYEWVLLLPSTHARLTDFCKDFMLLFVVYFSNFIKFLSFFWFHNSASLIRNFRKYFAYQHQSLTIFAEKSSVICFIN